jgi:BlaI family transcriptional regulator, penicillinase repressor
VTKAPPLPTDAELEILKILWDKGPSPVRTVHETLEESRSITYTGVLKLLQVMHQKGLVERDESQRKHIYAAALPPERTQEHLLASLCARAFGGSAARLIQRALSATRATPAEREMIRALLADESDDA